MDMDKDMDGYGYNSPGQRVLMYQMTHAKLCLYIKSGEIMNV